MAINKKLLHFNEYQNFNSKKLSANGDNTQYTIGVGGQIYNGEDLDIKYQSIVFIKDTKQIWTHGQLYNQQDVDLSDYYTKSEVDLLLPQDIDSIRENANKVNFKQDIIQDLEAIREGAASGMSAEHQLVNLATVAKSGNYSDLNGLPVEITESTISNWGFTKNTGTYTKPRGGIPIGDLKDTIQKSLEKADNAIQEIKTINGQSLIGAGDLSLQPSIKVVPCYGDTINIDILTEISPNITWGEDITGKIILNSVYTLVLSNNTVSSPFSWGGKEENIPVSLYNKSSGGWFWGILHVKSAIDTNTLNLIPHICGVDVSTIRAPFSAGTETFRSLTQQSVEDFFGGTPKLYGMITVQYH